MAKKIETSEDETIIIEDKGKCTCTIESRDILCKVHKWN